MWGPFACASTGCTSTLPGSWLALLPDRICIHHGRIIFIELKAPGQKPWPIQNRRFHQLRNQGIDVRIIDHPSQIQELTHALRTP
ncbi:VRR-NUC domain-containing protein [Rothia nasimurium]|uniref:VRR-NUC domain-containing protein n=1 Tax=Rothia nasimurium TaxID=85336 RepID=UPI001F26525A|nr:VRR-NUC domain-containing protein [Rothia nasimurium]